MEDTQYMRRALALARRAAGRTSPNPLVGAVLVRNGRIVGEGYHRKAGTAHAEAVAIDNAAGRAAGSTLYVTLEPCCHTDKRTPPCTRKIIASGISRVVIAMEDPNPKVSGRGINLLKKAGISVVTGLLRADAGLMNEAYIKHITTGMPFVILKVAMTLDGKIATPFGESKWITGEPARRDVHRLRGRVDGILTAIGTVKSDDPQLTCRSGRGNNPMRILLDPDLEIDPDARLLSCPPRTLIVTRTASSSKKKAVIAAKGIEFIEHELDRADLNRLMERLSGMGLTSILIEGGSSLSSSCLHAGIVDKVLFYIAPKIIGGRDSIPAVGGSAFRNLSDAFRVERTSVRRIGSDFVIQGYIARS